MEKVWHPYTVWEEYHAGMWQAVYGAEREKYLETAVNFTGDAELYGAAMLRVIVEWPLSCEHNLTNVHQNRQAWVGHAACCLATGCPEDITRQAWGRLTQDQQDRANAKALHAIAAWEAAYAG